MAEPNRDEESREHAVEEARIKLRAIPPGQEKHPEMPGDRHEGGPVRLKVWFDYN